MKESFLEDGKVRDPKYIMHPPVEVLQAFGLYNRASSPNLTVFYASFHETVALHEHLNPSFFYFFNPFFVMRHALGQC